MSRWADEQTVSWADGDEEDLGLQEEHYVEGPDANGIKKVVEISYRDGQRVKKIRKFQVHTRTRRVPKTIQERKEWKAFSSTKGELSKISPDDVKLVLTTRKKLVAKKDEGDLINRIMSLNTRTNFKSKAWTRAETSEDGEGSGLVGSSGKYVAPVRRNMTDGKIEDINKIRVTNLPDITENELRELFKACGPIQRTYVAKDHQTGESKGFAFVTYYTKEDAQSAIDKFDGFGLLNLIIRVEWAK